MRRILLLCLLLPVSGFGQTKRFGDDLSTIHAARDRTYDVQHYALNITLDHPQKKIAGDVTITLQPINNGLSQVVLDSAELQIQSVDVNGRSVDFALRGEKLSVELGRPYNSNETITVKVRYEGKPRKGLFWVGGDPAYPDKPAQIWSQGEDEDSHYWFPSYDYPNEKATSETSITVSKPFMAISNGRLSGVTDGGSTRTFHWKMDKPHSAYLTSIAVGDLEEYKQQVDDVSVEYYVPKGTGRDKTFRSFGRTPDMLRFFEDKIGIEYPYEKYAQVAVVDFLFGGMENITATTQAALTLHDERANQDYKSEGLVAHELAHQWWGDLVTCADWSHIWLNEGFATYFEALYTRQWLGEDEFRYEMYKNAESYFTEDTEKYRRPIVSKLYTEPFDLFDTHTYEKGSLVLRMIHRILGDEQFFKALRHYGEKFRDKNVQTDDLRQAIFEATGQNLEGFFDDWLYHGGHPEYDVAWTWENNNVARVTVRQKQKIDDLTRLFNVPVAIDFTLPGGNTQTFTMQIDKADQTLFFPLPARPLMVRFDPGNYILKKIDFPKDKVELLYQATNDSDVIGRIRAVNDLAKLTGDESVLNALIAILKSGAFHGVRAAAATALGKLKGDVSRDALIQATTDANSRVRLEAVTALGQFQNDQQALAAIVRVLQSDTSYAAQARAAKSVQTARHDKAFEVLTAALATDSHRDVVRRNALSALAELNVDDQVRPIVLEWTAYGRNVATRQTAISLLPKVADGAEDSVIERLIELTKDPWIFSRDAAIEALGEMKATEAIDELETNAQSEASGSLRKAAREAIAKIRAPATPPSAEIQTELDRLKRENQDLKGRLDRLEQQLAGARR